MMIRTQVYLPEELHRELKLAAAARGVNYSSLIRTGVTRVLEDDQVKKKNNDWKSFIGAGGKGKKTNAVRMIHDYYRYDAI